MELEQLNSDGFEKTSEKPGAPKNKFPWLARGQDSSLGSLDHGEPCWTAFGINSLGGYTPNGPQVSFYCGTRTQKSYKMFIKYWDKRIQFEERRNNLAVAPASAEISEESSREMKITNHMIVPMLPLDPDARHITVQWKVVRVVLFRLVFNSSLVFYEDPNHILSYMSLSNHSPQQPFVEVLPTATPLPSPALHRACEIYRVLAAVMSWVLLLFVLRLGGQLASIGRGVRSATVDSLASARSIASTASGASLRSRTDPLPETRAFHPSLHIHKLLRYVPEFKESGRISADVGTVSQSGTHVHGIGSTCCWRERD
ncbi:hypothetical protein C8J56DRAFT_897304 [Mycena floridula]|nr:hypothetical protein C8J56DRAFT_897304 [Mycena floridula]